MTSLVARIRADLLEALKGRDMPRAKLLRTTLAAIENAEAVEGVSSVEGIVGYGDVSRRMMTDEDVAGIISSEVEEWQFALAEYERIGKYEKAESLRYELGILRGYLDQGDVRQQPEGVA
jgi:uncharacterized protein YqeY